MTKRHRKKTHYLSLGRVFVLSVQLAHNLEHGFWMAAALEIHTTRCKIPSCIERKCGRSPAFTVFLEHKKPERRIHFGLRAGEIWRVRSGEIGRCLRLRGLCRWATWPHFSCNSKESFETPALERHGAYQVTQESQHGWHR